MKANEDKCHLLISNNKTVSMKINGVDGISSEFENLLGIKIDFKLNFEHYLNSLCKRLAQNFML